MENDTSTAWVVITAAIISGVFKVINKVDKCIDNKEVIKVISKSSLYKIVVLGITE